MRGVEAVRRRVEAWEEAKGRFFPPLFVGRETMDAIIMELHSALDEKTLEGGHPSSIVRRIDDLNSQSLSQETAQYVRKAVIAELKWVLGEESEGALRKVVWDVLAAQLHDAECIMRWDGTDVVLEGRGCPYDPEYPMRSFHFWLRLHKAGFKDDRQSPHPIEKIWLLYPGPWDEEFVLSAQDDTLSGLLYFSGVDFTFNVWDHTKGKPSGE